MASAEDDYRSSDDEDYVPDDNDEVEKQDIIDDAEESELVDGDDLEEKPTKQSQQAETKKPQETDIDALFAELTGQDPLLLEMERRQKAVSTPSTSKQENPEKTTEKNAAIEDVEKLLTPTTADSSPKPSENEPVKPTNSKKRVGVLEAAKILSKRSKQSVLDKSDHDWKEFTSANQLVEDLTSHNRGKGGYLNKLDFLSRTDNRVFETEKNMRAAMRKDNL